MPIRINTGFEVGAPLPLDSRFELSKAEMLAVNDNVMPALYFALCTDDNAFYLYAKTNTVDQHTGKFRYMFDQDGPTDESEVISLISQYAASPSDMQTVQNQITAILADAPSDCNTFKEVSDILSLTPTESITDEEILSLFETYSGVRYGIKVDKNDSNPATRCTYMYDAEGMTPAKMVYTSGEEHFDMGSWGDAFFIKSNYPCMVKFDGTEDYKLDPEDHTKKLDGTASDVANLNYDGNAMSCFGQKIYLKEWSDDDYEYYVISDIQYDETYECKAFINKDGEEVDKIYCPMYKGYKDSNNKLRSISGTTPTGSTTTADEITYLENCGSRWQTLDWSTHELLSVLLLLMSCNDDSQAAFGQGRTTGGSSASSTNFATAGIYNDKGQFWGTNTTNNGDVKVFYIQSYWGNRFDRCMGCMTIGSQLYIKWNPPYSNAKTYTNLTTEATLLADGYIKATKADTTAYTVPTSSGYQGKCDNTWGRLPIATNGTQTTYNCDYYSYSSGTRLALFGGASRYGAYCGAWYVGLYSSADTSYWNIGASAYLK